MTQPPLSKRCFLKNFEWRQVGASREFHTLVGKQPSGTQKYITMVLNERNLDLIASEDMLGRRITHTLYCSECGYNLKTLPYKYQCPECGNSYDVHPKNMTGIYLYDMDRFPYFDVFSTLFLFVACLIIMPHAFNPFNIFVLMITLVLDVMAILFAIRSYHRFWRFIRSCSIARHINEQEEDFQED